MPVLTPKPRMLPKSERETCRGPRIYNNYHLHNRVLWLSCLYTQASTAASHDLAIELRVLVSLKALVNAYSNIYCPLVHQSARFPFGRCKNNKNKPLFVRFLEKVIN